jgi:hypothetical protein
VDETGTESCPIAGFGTNVCVNLLHAKFPLLNCVQSLGCSNRVFDEIIQPFQVNSGDCTLKYVTSASSLNLSNPPHKIVRPT